MIVLVIFGVKKATFELKKNLQIKKKVVYSVPYKYVERAKHENKD